MAISLGAYKQEGQKRLTAEKLAREYRKQQKKAKKRGFFSSMGGMIGGKLLGGLISGALGVVSGGLAMPFIMGGSNLLAKKVAAEATKGMGAKTGGLKADEYGYGEEQAKTLREGLEAQSKAVGDTSLGKELLGSFVTAGMSGELGNVGKALKGGEGATKGMLMGTSIGKGGKEIIGSGKGLFQAGKEGLQWGDVFEGGKAGFSEALTDMTTWGGEKEDAKDIIPGIEIEEDPEYQEWLSQGVSYEEEGGLIPEYNVGGLVQAQAQAQPTIADYFGMQGKSLGGSNKHSLAEMLGRK